MTVSPFEPEIQRDDRNEVAEGHPDRAAAGRIDEADNGARREHSCFWYADELLAPREAKLHPVVAGGAILEPKGHAVPYAASQFEKALRVEARGLRRIVHAASR